MRPNSPSAIVTSLILHGFVAAVIFVAAVKVFGRLESNFAEEL
jgi:hypothetical protein